jgi:hypothetical protein
MVLIEGLPKPVIGAREFHGIRAITPLWRATLALFWIRFFSSAMLDVITEAIDLAAGDDDVRCVVFIGEGRAFWAGA